MGKNRKRSSGAAIAERPAAEEQIATGASPEQKPRRSLSRGKKLVFAIVTMLVFPAVVVLLLELTLRVSGYGYPAAFFLETRIDGKPVLTDNPRFGWRFFPPTIARRPHDFVIPARKPADTFRIFLFGESAAWGDPDPSYGMSRILERLLTDQFPELRFEVVNSAMAAISSHVVYQIAAEAAEREPDAFIVYMGNNEVIGPFGPGTVFSGFSRSVPLIRAAVWLKGQALVQLLTNVTTALNGRDKQPQAWAGMQMFEQNKVRSDDPRLETMYRHFHRNLRDIVRAGRRAGAGVIVCNLAANFGGWGPHASLHRPGMTSGELSQWQNHFDAGRKEMEAGNWSEALARLVEAEAIDATYAELQFRIGRCHEHLQQSDLAKRHYARAIDEDCLRFRTDSRENGIIQSTAAAESVTFLDIRKIFDAESPNGIPSLNLLDDHVHMNFRGNYLIARALLPEVARLVQSSRNIAPRNLSAPLSESECSARLACTGYNRYRITERNLQRVKNPPFTAQPDHEEHLAHFTRLLDELTTHVQPAGLRASADEYRMALTAAPDDWVLHENLADLFQRGGNSPGEVAALRRLLQLLPHHEERYAWLGQSLLNQGQLKEAEECYRKAIAYDRLNNKAYTGLGLALMKQGKTEEGLKQYEAAVRVRPGVAEICNELGQAYYRADRFEKAAAAFEEATRLQPDYALAYTNLGVLHISMGKAEQSIPFFEKAIELRPDFPDALRHLSSLYLNAKQASKAAFLYENAIKANARSAELRSGLAAVYMQTGRPADGIREFETAVSLQPDRTPLRRALALALAESGRKPEAAAQIREALRRDPGNPECRAILQALEREGF